MKVSRVSEMRGMDQTAIEQFGISAELLMENAGHAAYFALRNEFGVQNKRFLLFCGLGNNGGDGLVLARKIHANGGEVQVILLGDPSKYQGPAETNYAILSRLPVAMWELNEPESAREAIGECDLLVDAIFGTGLTREVEGVYREVVELINESHKPVLSIDIPSGVHGDTGKVMGAAVRADLTVTFGLPKLGNMLSPGYELCGKLFVSHISFPPSLHQSESIKVEINQPVEWPPSKPLEEKVTPGKLLIIGGASGNPEAAYISTLATLKSGCEHLLLAAPESIAPFISSKVGEIALVNQEETENGSISITNKDRLLQLANDMDMVVLGPGLSLQMETQRLVRELAMEITRPLLIDGDGIAAFYADIEILQKRTGGTILTPDLEEMAQITSKSLSEVDVHKVDTLQEAAETLNATIVLKGIQSSIGLPDRRVFINMSGIGGVAATGSGDILAGVIAAMHCLSPSLEYAARQGTFIHGLAVDLAAQEMDKHGLTVLNILDHLPLAVSSCWEGLNQEFIERYAVHNI